MAELCAYDVKPCRSSRRFVPVFPREGQYLSKIAYFCERTAAGGGGGRGIPRRRRSVRGRKVALEVDGGAQGSGVGQREARRV